MSQTEQVENETSKHEIYENEKNENKIAENEISENEMLTPLFFLSKVLVVVSVESFPYVGIIILNINICK